jgi:hypothetical protein
VQAEIATDTRRVKMAQPTMVSVVLRAVLVMAGRTSIEPPHAPGSWRSLSPFLAPETGTGTGTHGRSGRCPHQPKTGPESADDYNSKALGRRRHAMARSPFEN